MTRSPAQAYTRTLLAAVPEIASREPRHDRRRLVPRGRLRPVSVGGARLAGPVAWALVGLLGLVTLVAVFARLLAPHDPIQPVGPLNLPPARPATCSAPTGSAATCFAGRWSACGRAGSPRCSSWPAAC